MNTHTSPVRSVDALSAADSMDRANEELFRRLGLGSLPVAGEVLSFTLDGHRIMSAPVFVTSDLAGSWLAKFNDGPEAPNRTLSQPGVRSLVGQMQAGAWRVSHQNVIAFDENGDLLDGQHRLGAISKIDGGVWFRVEVGWPRAAFAVIDSGIKRQAGQLADGPYGNLRAATAKVLAGVAGMVDATRVTDEGLLTRPMNSEENLAWMAAWPELEELAAVCQLVRSRCKINAALHLAVMAQASRTKYAPMMGEWLDRLASGAELTPTDPRLLLRNLWIEKSRELSGSSSHRRKPYITIVKAWNAYALNKEIKMLKVGDSEAIPRLAGTLGK